jgi:hypothetical protein
MATPRYRGLVSLAATSVVSLAAMALSASVSSADTGAGKALNANHVAGEKLDSGLGELGPGYTGRELLVANPREAGGSPAQPSYHVAGEKLDSGLGELPPYHTWTAKHRWGPESRVKQASK